MKGMMETNTKHGVIVVKVLFPIVPIRVSWQMIGLGGQGLDQSLIGQTREARRITSFILKDDIIVFFVGIMESTFSILFIQRRIDTATTCSRCRRARIVTILVRRGATRRVGTRVSTGPRNTLIIVAPTKHGGGGQ